jgi:uncharacterized YigZ family protein
MSSRYPVPDLPPDGVHTAQILVRRSRFLAALGHCPNIEAGRAFIRARREACAGSSHDCWAFCAGPPGDTARIAYGDDGEPRGSAGRPILTVLLHGGVGELVCVVSRWFGGVKLGITALAGAYRDAARTALESLPVRRRVDLATLDVTAEYRHVDGIRRILGAHEARLMREEFTDRALLCLNLPEERVAEFVRAVTEHSSGGAHVRRRAPSSG